MSFKKGVVKIIVAEMMIAEITALAKIKKYPPPRMINRELNTKIIPVIARIRNKPYFNGLSTITPYFDSLVLTMFETRVPSALPLTCGIMAPMTFPISAGLLAPVLAIASSTIFAISSSGICSGM